MNETDAVETPISEAVKGYMRDRTLLLTSRESINLMWTGADALRKKYDIEIGTIDAKVAELLKGVK